MISDKGQECVAQFRRSGHAELTERHRSKDVGCFRDQVVRNGLVSQGKAGRTGGVGVNHGLTVWPVLVGDEVDSDFTGGNALPFQDPTFRIDLDNLLRSNVAFARPRRCAQDNPWLKNSGEVAFHAADETPVIEPLAD